MDKKKSYQLLSTYVKLKYYISTAYRRASTAEEVWYFETIVWEWDSKTRERGKMLEMQDSGMSEEMAIDNHFILVKESLTN